MSDTVYQFDAPQSSGQAKSLSDYSGKVLLIVNTASHCGFTPQYQGLQKLYEKFADQGLEILAFPCNQFGKQEPGSDDEIHQFCDMNYQIRFPVFSKIEVNGDNALPLYQHLKKAAPGLLGSTSIKWNFTKFLVDKKGTVLKRYSPKTTPEQIEADIAALLEA